MNQKNFYKQRCAFLWGKKPKKIAQKGGQKRP